MGREVPERTYDEWARSPPGFLEIDLVPHCGRTLVGSFIHSLVATDTAPAGPRRVPLLGREQSLVVEGLDAIGWLLPLSIIGIDSDNASAFSNETLIRWCAGRDIEFTRPGHTTRTT